MSVGDVFSYPLRLLFAAFIVATLTFSAQTAFADCSSPAGPAGRIEYFSASEQKFKYCDGANWLPWVSAIDDIADVSAATPGDGEILLYSAGVGAWVPGTLAFVSGGSSGAAGDYQVFTADGTWTKPAGLSAEQLVIVEMWGGGGGGNSNSGSGGGGGGAYNRLTLKAGSLGATVAVTVGAGGAVNTAGGTSSFGSFGSAYGGGRSSGSGSAGGGGGGIQAAGANASSATGAAGGAPMGGAGGASGSNPGGDSSHGGGGGGGTSGGGTGGAGGSSVYGGGGGGGGGATGGNGGPSVYGGGGGAGGQNSAFGGTSVYGGAGGNNGAAGSIPGGGGGKNAAGARGEVRVWVVPAGGSGGAGGASALDDLTDVDTTGYADGQVLMYSAGASGWVSGTVPNAGFACPSGFSLLQKNGQTLGCIQDTPNAGTTCPNAIDSCWASYGGRLPSYSEYRAGLAESIVSTGTDFWFDTGYFDQSISSRACGVLRSDNTNPSGASYNSSIQYHCFIAAGANGGGAGGASALDDLTDVDTTGYADGQVLMYSAGASGWVPGTLAFVSGGSSGAAGDYQVFTADGTWTKPAGVSAEQLVIVEMWGGGGGGSNNGTSAGGGGGGAYNRLTLKAGNLGATVAVTVGAGGGLQAAGGNTSFGSFGSAYGGGSSNAAGGGGGGGTSSIGGNTTGTNGATGGDIVGGAGGTGGASPTVGDASTYGGGGGGGGSGGSSTGGDGGASYYGGGGGGGGSNGGTGGDGGASVYGGGGGGGGGNTTYGGTSVFGGAGGNKSQPGNIPGGGGGKGAVGARGEVRVWVVPAGGAGGGSADNLGDHTATQNIQLGTNWLSNDGGNEGLRISTDGKVGVGVDPTVQFEVYGAGTPLLINGTGGDPGLRIRKGDAGVTNVVGGMINTGSGSVDANRLAFGFNTVADYSGFVEKMALTNAGNLGIGTTTMNGKLNIQQDSTAASGNTFGAYINGAQSTANTGTYYGTFLTPTFTAASGNTLTTMIGLASNPKNTNSGTVTNLWGISAVPQNTSTGAVTYLEGGSFSPTNTSSGTVTTMYAVVANPQKTGTGAVTTMYGLWSRCENANATGAVTNCYGLYLDTPITTGAITNKYGVYQADTNSANYLAGNTALNAAFTLSGDLSPAQITANQNDYNPASLSTAAVLRLNTDASRDITGLAGGADGRILTVINVGSFNVVLKNENAGSAAANRFTLNADTTLAPNQSTTLIYDSTATRWRPIILNTSGGDNLGNHTATQNIQLGSNWLSGDGGNEGVYISSSGNVGINTNNPYISLTVAGPVESATWPFNSYFNDSTAYAQGVGGGIGFGGLIDGTGVAWMFAGVRGGKENGTSGDKLGYLSFHTRNAAGSQAEAMRISSGGNVGIGTTGPGYRLHVKETKTDTSGWKAMSYSELTVNPASASSAEFDAAYMLASPTGSQNLTNTVIGGNGTVSSNNTGTLNDTRGLDGSTYNTSTGTISGANGVRGNVYNDVTGTIASAYGTYGYIKNKSTGVITNATGAMGLVNNSAAGTVTNAYGLYSELDNAGGGTVANWYGLYIPTITGTAPTTNRYGIYVQDAGRNYLAGDIGIGTTTFPGWSNGNGRSDIILTGTVSGYSFLLADGQGLAWNDATTKIDGDSSSDTIWLNTNNANRLIIDANGMVNMANGVALSGDLSPAQITANQNNYNPANLSTASVLRLSTDAARDITGLAGGADGRIITIINVGSFNIVLKNENASSTAANRFTLNADLTLTANQSTTLIYDSTSTRWRPVVLTSAGGGTPGGSNTQVQFNNSGSFGGDAGLVWDNTNKKLTVTNSGTTGIGFESLLTATTGNTQGGRFIVDSTSGKALYALAAATTGATKGVEGAVDSTSGMGVHGAANASSGSTKGVYGTAASTTGSGVYGEASAATGTNYGVYGIATSTAGYGVYSNGNFGVTGAVFASGDLSPAQITANQNDYNPANLAGAAVLRLNTNASRDITGLAGGADGRIITIINVGSFNIVLKNENASSIAANRFTLNADITLTPNQSTTLIYDSTSTRWRPVILNSAGGDNLGNHTATQNIVLGTNYLSRTGTAGKGLSFDASDYAYLADRLSISTTQSRETFQVGRGFAFSLGGTLVQFGNASYDAVTDLRDEFYGYVGTGYASESKFDPTNGTWNLTVSTNAGADGAAVTWGAGLSITKDNAVGIGPGWPNANVGFDMRTSMAWAADNTPSQITANQNDYAPANFDTSSVLRLSTNASRDITGLAGGLDGRIITIINIGSNNIVLKNENASSTAANRFKFGADVTLAANQSAMLWYDSTDSRWKGVSTPASASVESVSGLSAPSYGLSCTRRTATTSTAALTVSCNAGEIMTGGGCTHTSTTATIEDSGPTADTTWSCEWSAAAATGTAYAICCSY